MISVSTGLKKAEKGIEIVTNNLNILNSAIESNTVRIGLLEEKAYNISLSVKGVENRVMKRVTNLELWMESAQFEASIREKPNKLDPEFHREYDGDISTIKQDLAGLHRSKSADKKLISQVQGCMKELQGKLDDTVADITASTYRMEDVAIDRRESSNHKSLGIVKLGIERYVQQINQLISTQISQDASDLKLIEKCNDVDVPKVSKAITSCSDALEKYVRLPRMDPIYVDEVSRILVQASSWCLEIEELYSQIEIHSITNTKGDTSDVGIFSDNSTQTIYEFLQDVELAIMEWGNKQQRANKLVNKHLSPTIRDKVVDKAHDYAEIKTWLIEHYGDASRIVNDTITALAKKKKPSPGSAKDRYKFYSEIVVSILRLERLTKEKLIDTVQLNDCLHSRSTGCARYS